MTTPREDGLRMPAEWAPHQATLMEWPTITRAEIWGDLFDRAKADFAAMANAVAAFEPVVMVTPRRLPRRGSCAVTASRSCRSRSTTPGCATTARSS